MHTYSCRHKTPECSPSLVELDACELDKVSGGGGTGVGNPGSTQLHLAAGSTALTQMSRPGWGDGTR